MNEKKNIEILCPTMHQNDFSKYYEMNIHGCDVLFTNQADQFSYQELIVGHNSLKMLTTATVGVGKNRNFALELSSGEILLFADDDLIYEPDMSKIVRKAFEEFADADMIVFGTKYTADGKVYKYRKPKTGKLSFFKSLRYGTYAIAVRRKSVLMHNIHFSELFGGGCIYSYGEDTDFIIQCFRKHLKIYAYGEVIASTSKNASTCFSGYGEKFYFDRGALAKHSMGLMTIPYMIRMSLKDMNKEHVTRKDLNSNMSFRKKMRLLWSGYRCFPNLISYTKWASENEKDHNC